VTSGGEGPALLDQGGLRLRIERLAAFERPAASPGEREAAELIAAELSELGLRTHTERIDVHGTYWWPAGLATGAGALAGVLRRRPLGTLLGLVAAAAMADDVGAARRQHLRRLLARRRATNVIAELGDRNAPHTLLVVAHHDAAHTGLVFSPTAARAPFRRFPRLHARTNTTAPLMWPAVGAPLAAALGQAAGLVWLRRLGALVSAAYAAAMVDIGRSPVVAGANDNLSGVAAMLSLARALAARPPVGLRVVLLSNGAEESHQEGMVAFARRHLRGLDPDRTHVVCLDTVGSPHLLMLEGEGMLAMHEYQPAALALVQSVADELGVFLWRGLRLRNATDGLVTLRAGLPTVMLGSVDRWKLPTDYHWPTDTPDRVDLSSVADAARLCLALTERLGRGRGASPD
jgi:putative aminopeptidase FrvX